MTYVLIRDRKRDYSETHRYRGETRMKRPCEGNGRDWRVFTSQEIPRISSSHQKLEESHGTDSPSELPE